MSILSALLILVSGMQLSLSAHLCNGDISSVKWSFYGEKASCSMHDVTLPANGESVLKTDCCHNNNYTLRVDKHYSSSSIAFPEEINRISIVYLRTDDISASWFYSAIPVTNHFVFPEKDILAGGVSLPALCTFRI